MHANTIALAIAPLLLAVRASSDDLEVDASDVPRACRSICRPVVELSRRCEVDLRDRDYDDDNDGDDREDRDERLLERQCVCANDSFDVPSYAALCGDCIRQNLRRSTKMKRDDDDDNDDGEDRFDAGDDEWDANNNNNNNNDDDDDANDAYNDIRSIMFTCGFSSTSYATSASNAAESITVQVTRPTNINQLTTTISPGATNTNNARPGTATSSSNSAGATQTGSGSNDDDGSNTNNQGGQNDSGSSSSTNNDDDPAASADANNDDDGNAAPASLIPVTMAALASVFGAALLLA